MLNISKKTFIEKKCLLIVLCLFLTNSHAYLRDAQTTRIQSLGGAGVASLLLNESTILNPAAIAFFGESTFYYQKGVSDLQDRSDKRNSKFKDGANELILLTDTSSSLRGGISYQRESENGEKRIRYTASMASAITKKSAFGLIYRYTDENSAVIEDKYHQVTLGYTYVYNQNLILATTVVDPNQRIAEQFKYTFGAQYSLSNNIMLIADIGSGDVANSEKESFTKVALQLQTFQRIYLRYARFNDKHENLKGFAYGASWVGPKFSIDYAYKKSEVADDSRFNLFNQESLVENSLSLTALF